MTSGLVQGLTKRLTFYEAAKLAEAEPYRLYFPEEAARHIVDSPLYTRISEVLQTQDDAVR